MRKLYLLTAATTALMLALGGTAFAGGHGLGSVGGQPAAPPGLSNTTGGHNGFDSQTTSAFPNGQPKGWDQGSAGWKDPTDATQPLPPGFAKPNH
jgi:hypothetical protein